MPVTILPRSTDSKGTEEAQARLQAEIDDPYSVVMIILGEDAGINRVVEVGVARASLALMRRRVVWSPDPAVLTPEQMATYFPKGEVASFVGLDNKVITRLKLAKAQVPFFVEEAFTAAGA